MAPNVQTLAFGDGRVSQRAGGRKWICVLTLVGLFPGCAWPPEDVVVRGPTMGTYYRVQVVAEAGDREAIRDLVQERLIAVELAMSTWFDDSEISRFNGLAAGEQLAFSEETWAVLELAWRVREETEGAFDPTVGPLVDAWGFGAPGRGDEPTPPDEDQLLELQAAVGAIELSSTNRQLRKLHALSALDFSAVAKGWAVDRVSADLTAAGHANHLVEVGGEVRTSGQSGAGGPWRVAIERPPTPGEAAEASRNKVYLRLGFGRGSETPPPGVQQVLEFTDGALATSGDYRNYWERDGVRYSHTIDPRTGRPVEHALASASVIHESCAVADAYATALMVLGPDEGLRWADRNGVAALLLIYREDSLEERPSAAFRAR